MPDDEEILTCPHCRLTGLRDSWAMNPHFGYLRCPRCQWKGLDIMPVRMAEVAGPAKGD